MTDIPVKKKIGVRLDPRVVGPEIKVLRKSLKLDQRAFGEYLGVGQSVVSEWEKGEYSPSPMALIGIGRLCAKNREHWFDLAGNKYAERIKSPLLWESKVSSFEKINQALLTRVVIALDEAINALEGEIAPQMYAEMIGTLYDDVLETDRDPAILAARLVSLAQKRNNDSSDQMVSAARKRKAVSGRKIQGVA